MTAEEAYRILSNGLVNAPSEHEWCMAFRMAIKALEQEPCEDDCVIKAEVINTIHKTIYGFFDIADDGSKEPINDKDKLLLTINKTISNAVKALPSVTPQRLRGKWVDNNCSICGYGVEVWNNTPYCPNCGAKMEDKE